MKISEYQINCHAEAVRLANVKTALATAIEGKGVTVPEGTLLDGMAPLVEAIESGVQPDWNQNDDTQPDYVKNRPFYTGNPVETVLVEESTVTFAENNGLYMAEIRSTFEATVGETYKVSWDGTTYECTCVDFHNIPVIGNLSIVGGGSDTGEPFLMVVPGSGEITIGSTDTSASHTFSISATVVPVVKIDEKYLPDTLLSFKPAGTSYLTFSSLSSFTLAVKDSTKHWDGTLEYFASDKTWTVWDGTSALSAVAYDGGYVLYLRGTGNTVITGGSSNYRWVLTGTDIRCIGNIENLLDYATVESGDHPTMADRCYQGMFYGCTSLKLSSTQTGEYTQEYRIPSSGNGTTAIEALINMFTSTGGTFTGTPAINTTYYLSSDNMIVRETEIATLNGYVGSMIDFAIEEYADTAEYIIHSSTEGSTKKFKITVDDSGTLTATEVS